MIDSTEIPQATLQRIRAVVDAVADGARSTEEVGQRTRSAPRHAAYGVVAARVLGLLGSDRRTLQLSEQGQSLAGTRPGSGEELVLLRAAISQSEVVTAIAPGLLGETPPSKAEIEEAMCALSLSPSTAKHRAAMLLRWRSDLGGAGLADTELRRAPRGMWRQIRLVGFRSFEDSMVELPPFAVLVGPNGSGKSNFIDALLLLHDVAEDAAAAVSSRGGPAQLQHRSSRVSQEPIIDLRAAATRRGLETDYVRHYLRLRPELGERWSFAEEQIERVVHGERKAALSRRDNAVTLAGATKPTVIDATESAMVTAARQRKFSRTAVLRNTRRFVPDVEQMRQPAPSDAPSRLAPTGHNLAAAVASLRLSEDYPALLAFLSRLIVGLQDIEVDEVGRELVLRFRQVLGTEAAVDFDARAISEGALRALGIAVALFQMTREDLVILEEPQQHLDLGARWLLLDLLRQQARRGAVLVTTHSADLLEGVREDEVLVCQVLDGVSHIGPLAQAQQQAIRQGQSSVAGLLRSGALRIDNAPSSHG